MIEAARAKPRVRVVKVGGSLFELPDLGARLQSWLAIQPPALTVLLAGGGELAEVIRRADQRHGLGETNSHWICIEALGVTAQWLSAILLQPRIASSIEEVCSPSNTTVPEPVVFDPRDFLREQEPKLGGQRLGESWDVTSDSIAARLCVTLQADELVLLKSRSAPPFERLEELAQAGFVDAFFPRAAETLDCVRFENLRG